MSPGGSDEGNADEEAVRVPSRVPIPANHAGWCKLLFKNSPRVGKG